MKTSSPARPKLSAELERRVGAEADAIIGPAWELARAIFEKPETAYQETFAADALAEFMSGHGFRVTRGAGGLPTALEAEAGRSGPTVGFLAEMDALPEIGHACGHHLIAASSAAAAVVLARVIQGRPGRVRLIGCPAEEGGGGKIILARAGVFDGLDAAVIAHPDVRTEVYKRSLGMVEIGLVFIGKASHAAARPDLGVNALDALVQTFNAVNVLRQQLPDKQRVHGVITDGGRAPNIIPERAAGVFLARGLTRADTLELAGKIVRCARGAAGQTGTRVKVSVKKSMMYDPYVPSRALGGVYDWALDRLGAKTEPGPEDEAMGSTDVGAVCARVPVIHPLVRVPGATEGVHTTAFARAAGGPGGRTMLDLAIRANALTGAVVVWDKKIQARIKQERRSNPGQESG